MHGEGPAPEVDEATYRAHARFRHMLRRFLRFSAAQARKYGITPEQHQLLLAIRASRRGWLLVGEVARVLLVSPHAAVGLVERAASRGLVCKETDPEDRRRVRVTLTAEGADLIARLTWEHRSRLRALWWRIPTPQ
jgi:DNA-binding MarR family transcriptional regulator